MTLEHLIDGLAGAPTPGVGALDHQLQGQAEAEAGLFLKDEAAFAIIMNGRLHAAADSRVNLRPEVYRAVRPAAGGRATEDRGAGRPCVCHRPMPCSISALPRLPQAHF